MRYPSWGRVLSGWRRLAAVRSPIPDRQVVLATVCNLPGRPPYEVFDVLANAKSSIRLKLGASRQIAAVLLDKLRSANALLSLSMEETHCETEIPFYTTLSDTLR